jgi:hypothetical protein
MWQAVQKYFMYKAHQSPCVHVVRTDILLQHDPLFMAVSVSTVFTVWGTAVNVLRTYISFGFWGV